MTAVPQTAADWTTTVNYDLEDVVRLVKLPYVRMMRADSALYMLRREADLLGAWGEFLPRYRSIVCEHLEFAYRYLRCLAALDTLLIDDLLTHFGWRGIVMGAWLVALQPRPEFREPLLQARPRAPKNTWLVNLAVAAIDGTSIPGFSEHQQLFANIARALARAPRPAVNLKRISADTKSARETREAIREIYRSHGADTALAYLAGVPLATRHARSWYRDCPNDSGANPGWSWGMSPPFSWQDLINWRTSVDRTVAHLPQSRCRDR